MKLIYKITYALQMAPIKADKLQNNANDKKRVSLNFYQCFVEFINSFKGVNVAAKHDEVSSHHLCFYGSRGSSLHAKHRVL